LERVGLECGIGKDELLVSLVAEEYRSVWYIKSVGAVLAFVSKSYLELLAIPVPDRNCEELETVRILSKLGKPLLFVELGFVGC
jgi:hypothetical protein